MVLIPNHITIPTIIYENSIRNSLPNSVVDVDIASTFKVRESYE